MCPRSSTSDSLGEADCTVHTRCWQPGFGSFARSALSLPCRCRVLIHPRSQVARRKHLCRVLRLSECFQRVEPLKPPSRIHFFSRLRSSSVSGAELGKRAKPKLPSVSVKAAAANTGMHGRVSAEGCREALDSSRNLDGGGIAGGDWPAQLCSGLTPEPQSTST